MVYKPGVVTLGVGVIVSTVKSHPEEGATITTDRFKNATEEGHLKM